MINREDMLELTRRMTLSRNSLSRIAGCYTDSDGEFDGSFNIHFQKLSATERSAKLKLARTVPFSETNINLKQYTFSGRDRGPDSAWRLLMTILDCGLENDALLDIFYDLVMENYQGSAPYAIFLFYGCYDVPLKASDKESLWESEEVYRYLICTIGPLAGEYEPGPPECGFLFPAFSDRSADVDCVNVFQANPRSPHTELVEKILKGCKAER